MQRRTLLSRLGGGLAVASSTGVAGCVDAVRDFAECGDDSDTPREWDVDGEVTESSVEGLTITDHEASIDCTEGIDRPFGITATVQNSGDRQTERPPEFEYWLTLFDADENDITPRLGTKRRGDSHLDPGESGEVTIIKGNWHEGNGPADVAHYELSVGCQGESEGVHCEF